MENQSKNTNTNGKKNKRKSSPITLKRTYTYMKNNAIGIADWVFNVWELLFNI